MTLPYCMMGPSGPCDGFAETYHEVERLRVENAKMRAALEGCLRIAENGCSKAVVDALRNHVRVFLAEQDK